MVIVCANRTHSFDGCGSSNQVILEDGSWGYEVTSARDFKTIEAAEEFVKTLPKVNEYDPGDMLVMLENPQIKIIE